MEETDFLSDILEQTEDFGESPYGAPEDEILYDWNGGTANEGK